MSRSRPSQFRVHVFDEDGDGPFVDILSTLVRSFVKQTVIIGDDGVHLRARSGRLRFISFESFQSVTIFGGDVIVCVSIDSSVRLRTSSLGEAIMLRNALKEWFEIYNDLLLDADEVDSSATGYRMPACDPTWAIAFSPGRPIDERARAALHVLREDAAAHTPNAERLVQIAGASSCASFSTLVDALVTRKTLDARTRRLVARELGLRVEELT